MKDDQPNRFNLPSRRDLMMIDDTTRMDQILVRALCDGERDDVIDSMTDLLFRF
jgi:hypothetical protein